MELKGARVVITRPRRQADEFAKALRQAGALPISFPVIEIGPLEDYTALDRALCDLPAYDWLVLTSANGVEAVWERLAFLGMDNIPGGTKIAAIGPKTAAALASRGASVSFMPEEYVAEAMLPGLGDLHGRKILLARADIARPALANAIRTAGGEAHEIPAYRTLPARLEPGSLEALQAGAEIITFTSSSTVLNFVALVRSAGLDPLHLPGSPLVACIGPVTVATAREQGFIAGVVAAEYTTAGLLAALRRF
ncbi:MAG: uroporphyrinogen-III synthase [Omnitrophica WOR_2 bacterium]